MSDISKIPDGVLQGLQLPDSNQNTQSGSALGKDAFMTLMLAQLKNQNPMEPMTNGEFLGQIAQFTSANGISDLQQSFAAFASSMSSQQALQAASMVGRKVLVDSNQISWDGAEAANIRINLGAATDNVTISVSDAQGGVVRKIQLGSQAAGDVTAAWDGLDDRGNILPAGRYTVNAMAGNGDNQYQLTTTVSAAVNSVIPGRNGSETVLNLQDLGPVAFSQVREII